MENEFEPRSENGYNFTHLAKFFKIVRLNHMFSIFTVPPRNTTISIHPSRNVKEGENITITCKTFSHPPAVIILKRVDVANGVTMCSKNGTFTLYHVTQNDTGVYVISASNEVGDDSGRIEISVMSRLKFIHFYFL